MNQPALESPSEHFSLNFLAIPTWSIKSDQGLTKLKEMKNDKKRMQ